MERSKVMDRFEVGCATIYTHHSGVLYTTQSLSPENDKPLMRVLARMPRSNSNDGSTFTLIAKPNDAIALALQYTWADGRDIFDTNMQHLCNLLDKNNAKTHYNIIKWERYTLWSPVPKLMWKRFGLHSFHKRFCALLGKWLIEQLL